MLKAVLPEELIGNTEGSFAGEIQPKEEFQRNYESRIELRTQLHKIEAKYKILRAEFAELYFAKKKSAKYHQVHFELKKTLNKLIEIDRELIRSQIKIQSKQQNEPILT